MKMSNL